jgi:multicomponent Na+:H+ antiporter subunit F
MSTLFLVAAVVLALLLLAPLWRIARGPTIFDRLLGASMMGTKTTVLLLLMGESMGRLDMFVDISLGYGLALLAGTLVASKFLELSEQQTRAQAAERPPAQEGGP